LDINQKIIELDAKISNLKNVDIKNLENELFLLKQELNFTDSPLINSQNLAPEINPINTRQPIAQSQNIKKQHIKKQKPKKEKVDFEKKLGQNIMGILASLLIFIGLGLFIVLIYDYLTSPIKVFGMFVLSFSILGLGLFLFKKRHDIFSLSLTGCGIGSVYISILMTNVYFHYIGDIPMYSLIVAWLAGILYLSSKFKDELLTSNTISIIGQFGIVISVILGAQSFKTIQELFLISFFMIATSLMHGLLAKASNKNILKNISILSISVSSIVIVSNISSNVFIKNSEFVINPIVLGILAFMIIGYNLIVNFNYYDENSSKSWFKAIVIFPSAICLLIGADEFYSIITFITKTNSHLNELILLSVLALAMFVISEIKEQPMIIRIITFGLFNIVLIQLAVELDIIKYVGLSFIFVPMLVMGHVKKDLLYNIVGYIYLGVDVIVLLSKWSMENATWGMLEYFIIFLCLVASYAYMFYKEESYNVCYKIINYLIFLIATAKMFALLDFSYSSELSYVVITLLNILAYSSIFVCDWKSLNGFSQNENKKEIATNIICNLMNYLLTFIGFVLIYTTNSELWHYTIIIALTCACFIGSYRLLQKFKDTKWIGFYIGIKSTIYINAIFYSFSFLSANSYLSSISSLALAVIAIIIGFNLEVKSLRVFGLVLSMLSIFKLLLIDIQYDNSIGRVISFILAGLLCFGINFVYNVASKKIKK